MDKLRENVISAYVGILQSMCPEGYDKNPQIKEQAQNTVMSYAQQMVQLILMCCEPTPEASDALIGNVAGLIGDLVTLYGDKIISYLSNEKVYPFFYCCKSLFYRSKNF